MTVISHFMAELCWPPKASVSRSSTETVVTANSAVPVMTSRSRLLSLSRNGLGRLFRGTDQAMFIAFWIAVPRPSEP